MNLNMHIVHADLSHLCIAEYLITPPDELPCAAARLYKPGEQLREGFIYIARAEDLSGAVISSGTPAIMSIGEPAIAELRGRADLLVLCNDLSPDELLNCMADLFARYGAWENRLRQIVDNGEPVEELGLASFSIFDNPLYCQASGFKCVFLCLGDLDSAREDLREWMLDVFGGKRFIASGEYLPLEGIDRLLSDQKYLQASNDEGPTVYNHPTSPGETYFVNIGPTHAHIARVCVFEVFHPLTARDMALLCILARYIELAMRALNPMGYDAPSFIERISNDLLLRESVKKEDIHRALADISWRVSDRFFCVVLESMTGDTSWQTLQTTANYLDKELQGQLHFIFEDRLVYVFDLTVLGVDEDQLLRQVEPLFRDSMLRAGSSEAFEDYADLYYGFWQAKTALENVDEREGSFWFHRYRDWNHRVLLSRVKGDLPVEVFVPAGLRALFDYDERHESELARTLCVYLACNCSVLETARSMFISRSTCVYRIRRIHEIGKLNLEDPKVRLDLSIVFALMEE